MKITFDNQSTMTQFSFLCLGATFKFPEDDTVYMKIVTVKTLNDDRKNTIILNTGLVGAASWIDPDSKVVLLALETVAKVHK